MSTATKKYYLEKRNTMYWATWVVLVVLFTVSFYIPPVGHIDGSVLRAACILLAIPMLASIETILNSIKRGQKVKLQHGNQSIEVSNTGKENDQ